MTPATYTHTHTTHGDLAPETATLRSLSDLPYPREAPAMAGLKYLKISAKNESFS